MTMLRIEMPWPPRGLSPNARLHWARKRTLTAPYRAVGRSRAAQAMAKLRPIDTDHLPVVITFHPPDRRHRDDDNMIGAFKAGRDGIADGLGVNDRHFRPTYVIGSPLRGGLVVVEVPVIASVCPVAGEVEPFGT